MHVCLVLKMLALSIIPMLNSSPIDENPERFAQITDPQRSAQKCQHELQCKSQAKISKSPLRSPTDQVHLRTTLLTALACNSPFPSSPRPLFQNKGIGAQPLMWKSFFILIQIKLIFTRKVVHLASF